MNPSSPTLLCESCGYPLTSLEAEGACPECGRSIWSSLPARRTGSAFQRSEPGGWWATAFQFLEHPRDGFRRLAIERERSFELIVRSTLTASVLATTPWLMVAIAFAIESPRTFNITWAALSLLGAAAAQFILMLLASWIESLGIRFFAARRGWRVTPAVSAAVCAHAGVGWIVGGVVVAFAAFVAGVATLLERNSTTPPLIAVGGLILGAGVGLLWFETLVYVGVRECRFANAPETDITSLEHDDPQPPQARAVSSSDANVGAPRTGAYHADAPPAQGAAPPSNPDARSVDSPHPAPSDE